MQLILSVQKERPCGFLARISPFPARGERHWLRPAALAAAFLLECCSKAHSTSHVFMRTPEGVWLASDTLWGHADGKGHLRQWNECKVAITRSRLIFNAGRFRDIHELLAQERALPLASENVTEHKILEYQKNNRFQVPRSESEKEDMLETNSGLVQILPASLFTALWFGQTYNGDVEDHFVKSFQIGLPHGYSEAVSAVREKAAKDPRYAKYLATHPKRELLRILEAEAKARPNEVAGPFTVLLLRNDGTVQDFSEKKLCAIPAGAQR